MNISVTKTLHSDRGSSVRAGDLRKFLCDTDLDDNTFVTIEQYKGDPRDAGYITFAFTTDDDED